MKEKLGMIMMMMNTRTGMKIIRRMAMSFILMVVTAIPIVGRYVTKMKVTGEPMLGFSKQDDVASSRILSGREVFLLCTTNGWMS